VHSLHRGEPDRLEQAVVSAVAHRTDDMIDVRRHLHANPELSFEEIETTAFVNSRLSGLGLSEWPCPTPTGAVAMLEGKRPGRTVLLRADIDALPVLEELRLPFASTVEGRMHACGHDAHTAALLGVAGALGELRESLPGRYLFVFQPAEERISGAQAMVDGGLFDEITPDAAIAMHVVTTVPTGSVLTRPGILMAGGCGVEITVTGSGGHGALQPRQGNVVLAASHIATLLHTAVEGMESEGTACVCSPGMLNAGSAPNVVPRTAVLAATLRWFEASQRDEALRRLTAITEDVATDFDVSVAIRVVFATGPVRNEESCSERALDAVARAVPDVMVASMPSPVPASDDVSVLLDRVPGCYLFVGAAQEGSGMHHSPSFSIDERAISLGAMSIAAAATRLAEHE